MPEADLGELTILRRDAQSNGLIRRDAPHAELQGVERDSAIGIRRALDADAEEVLGRLEGRRQRERPEERWLGLQRLLEAEGRDLARGRVDPAVVVVVDFRGQELVGLSEGRDIFPDTGPDEVILQPAVGPFDLPLGLRGEGVEGLDAALQEHLLPLGIDLIGEPVVADMELVPAPDEAEDRMAVDVVRIRIAVAQDEPLHRVDVPPDGLLGDELREEEEATEVIQRRDEVPCDRGGWRPEVVGRVVLDQLADVASEDLAVVELVRPAGEGEAVLLRPIDDGGSGR